MSPVPVATWLPDLRALAWLVALAREVIRPVYDHLARDTRLVPPGRRPRALDHVTRDAVAWVVSSAYGLSARQAADMSPNNSRGPLARSERANVNLNDIRSCDALTSNPLTGHGSRPLTFVVPPAGFQANPIARAASKAVAGANSGPTLQVELPTTGAAPVRFTGFPRDPDDGNWEPDTLAEVVLPVALGAIRAVTGDQNRVNTAYVALNPFLVVATGDPPEPLECARREFFQKWDEAVRPHLDPRSSFDSPDELTRAWTRAEEFWGANRWPGRDHPRPRRGQPDSPLRRWLRMVLFLGADRTYGGHEIPIQRDLGRSLVFQVLGFQERPRVKCRVCGAGAPHGGGEHQCPGLSGIQREPVFDDHYEIDHEDRDSGKVPYATCRRKRPEPADAVVLLRAPAAPDWTDAAPAGAGAIELTNAAGEPFGLGLHPPVPVRSAELTFTTHAPVARAVVECVALGPDAGPTLARITLVPDSDEPEEDGMYRFVPAVAPVPPESHAVRVSPNDHYAVSVQLLFERQTIVLRGTEPPGVEIRCRVAFGGCGHHWLWEHDPAGKWSPGTCPRCGGPASSKPSYFPPPVRPAGPGPAGLDAGRPVAIGSAATPRVRFDPNTGRIEVDGGNKRTFDPGDEGYEALRDYLDHLDE